MGRPKKEASENPTVDIGERRKAQREKLEALKRAEPELYPVIEKRLNNLWGMEDAAAAERATINRILGLGR